MNQIAHSGSSDAPRGNSFVIAALTLRTLAYALLLAALMQAAQTGVRLLMTLLLGGITSLLTLLSLAVLAGEIIAKITWSALICEALVWLTILARRRWILPLLVLLGVTLFAVAFGQLLRVFVESILAAVSTLSVQSALESAIYHAGKYVLLGPAAAWANSRSAHALRDYFLAGVAAAALAVAITAFVHPGMTLTTMAGEMVVDSLFPVGCLLVVWKVRDLAQPLIKTHADYRSRLRSL